MYEITTLGAARFLSLAIALAALTACGGPAAGTGDGTASTSAAAQGGYGGLGTAPDAGLPPVATDAAAAATAAHVPAGKVGQHPHPDCDGHAPDPADLEDDGDEGDDDADEVDTEGRRCAGSAAPTDCVPATCESLGKNCGEVADGCGKLLDCGACAANETCGGGGAPNVCGTAACTPTTCAAEGRNCGTIPDGCGGTVECGLCAAGETCGGGGVTNVCAAAACTPTTCAAQGKNCGSIPDGCGGTLTCGTCASGESCGGAGTANVCGATAAATPAACQPGAWANVESRIFTSSCMGCHAAYGTYAGVKADAAKIRTVVSSGAMPKGSSLSATDKQSILDWIDCGTPQ